MGRVLWGLAAVEACGPLGFDSGHGVNKLPPLQGPQFGALSPGKGTGVSYRQNSAPNWP